MAKRKYYEYDNERNGEKKRKLPKVDVWKLAKSAMVMVASGCASTVTNRYLKSGLPAPTSTVEKVVTTIGLYMITGLVSAKVSEYAGAELDDLKASFDMCEERKELPDGGEVDEA